MTREEKIKGLYSLKEYLTENPIELEGHKSLPITLIDYAIEALEQEPMTGHWNDIPKYTDIAWLCSECGHFTTMKRNYCPNCGAKMVEPQESEEE